MGELPNENFSNALGDGWKKFKSKLKVGGKTQLDVNCALNKIPLAMPRLGVLAGARLNIFGMSTRLYPALISEADAKARHFNLENRKKAIAGWEKAVKIWKNVGGCGDIGVLEKAIRQGYDKPVFKTKKVKLRQAQENGFDGEIHFNTDAGVSEALIIGGISIITSIIGAIAKSGASKNPYDGKSIDTSGMEEPALTPELQKQLEQLEELEKLEKQKEDKFLGMPKPVGITVAIVGGLLLAFGGYKLYKHFKK
jgi:hypothetical protein